MIQLTSAEALEAALRQLGAERYHNNHPFHHLMRDGKLTKNQIRAWALNRYYYQSRIPMKDAALMSRVADPELRRVWAQRVVDHDGTREGQGGVAKWLILCEDLGLNLEDAKAERGILAGTRFAVDAYVAFVRERTLLEAIASSLTEMFSPTIIPERTAAMLKHYDFVSPRTLTYFEARLTQAPRDAEHALAYVKEHARTAEQRRMVYDALAFKMDVLWTQLDCLYYAYVEPGFVPPGAFDPATLP